MAYPAPYSTSLSAEAESPADSHKFLQLQLLRGIIGSVITIFLCQTIDFGISAPVLVTAVLGGGIYAGFLLKQGKSLLRVLLLHGAVFLALYCGFQAANFLLTSAPQSGPATDFLVPQIADTVFIIAFFYSAAFLSSWWFWTKPQAVTLEGVLSAVLLVVLLSAHRNYHIDAPRQISSLTWKVGLLQRLQIEPQHLFLGVGLIFVLLLACYLVLAANRPLFGREPTVKTYGRADRVLSVVLPLLTLGLFFYFAQALNARYMEEEKRNSNGVGPAQAAKEGESNLGFHQAISPTRQPSALVRLESDYSRNPWSPMLYFREGALSDFNGRELVAAGGQYDTDVPRIGLGQPFLSAQHDPGPQREKVTQSIYLLTQHKGPFALDIPRRIAPIQNPYPDRFRAAYQALSYAPVTPVDQLLGSVVGSSQWDQKTWDHYLRAPGSRSLSKFLESSVNDESLESDEPVLDEHGEDVRYLALSRKLTGFLDDPVMKAAAVAEYLSQQSIYTRSPGHQTTQKGDPVAPYLFAKEKRGYCVHFSHAAAYLLRLAGVPTRIATGYLTDLTYAKDGHILLQTGDRHAWPEIYIEGLGWTVFDVTPARAENEQTLVPDEKLLDELMNKLNPVQELLDPVPMDAPEEERGVFINRVITVQTIAAVALLALVLFTMWKFYLRCGYRFAGDDRKRVKLAYTAFLALMADSGMYRHQGETRREYARRLQDRYGIDAERITQFNELSTYAQPQTYPQKKELAAAVDSVTASFDGSRSRLRRWVSFFNPFSLSRYRSW